MIGKAKEQFNLTETEQMIVWENEKLWMSDKVTVGDESISNKQHGHLSRHTKIHTGDKPHICLIASCHKRFSRKDSMMLHFQTHRKNLMHQNIPIVLKATRKATSNYSTPHCVREQQQVIQSPESSQLPYLGCPSPLSNTSNGACSPDSKTHGIIPTFPSHLEMFDPYQTPISPPYETVNDLILQDNRLYSQDSLHQYPSYDLEELIKIEPTELMIPFCDSMTPIMDINSHYNHTDFYYQPLQYSGNQESYSFCS
ncbi:transcriptional repressor [Globomyces sp. JEL0801]|nr:transcriptional repressor [Globomyces sp. JEL0801]